MVDNNDVLDADDNESESVGITYLKNGFGGDWVQTSYNRSFRKNYAAVGYTYDSARNAFIPPQPYSSWTLDEATCIWESPVDYPDDGKWYQWDESITNWVEVE